MNIPTVAPMCDKFLPHFELLHESFYIIHLLFKKHVLFKNLPRKCADDYPNAEISDYAI